MRTYISDSLISEALILLRSMKQNDCFTVDKIINIKTYYGINKESALNLALQCEWVGIDNTKTYEITTYGEKLLHEFDDMQISQDMYREILFNYVRICVPAWARRIPYGRHEAYRIMSDEEQICFKKAGLMNEIPTRDVVDWWDSLAKIERIKIDKNKVNNGRDAEELTIEYEKTRTNAVPLWESVNTNLAGFDIMSQASGTDSSPIYIEVKSSTKDIQNATFYITRNEWDIASAAINIDRYFFYIWVLGNSNKLAIIPSREMEKHIPQESGQGTWRETVIPFSAFEHFFKNVD